MPTVRVEYRPNAGLKQIIGNIVDELPRIVAPQMNIGGRELHDGGVSNNEIIVDATTYSQFTCNINDIQITVVAHAFQERKDRLDEATEAIAEGVKAILADYDRNVKVGISIWLVDMGYVTI